MRRANALLAILLLGPLHAAHAARPEPITEEDRTVVQVFDAPGYTKQQIFAGTKMWIASNFKSAKAVLEYEDAAEGTLIGNGVIPYPCKGLMGCLAKADWRVPFTMRVETKDGRFRLTFTNIHLAWDARYSAGISTPAEDFPVHQRGDLDAIRPVLLEFGDRIKASLSSAKTNDDW